MKRSLSLVLALILVLSCLSGITISAASLWDYEIKDGVAVVTGYHGSAARVDIPDEFEGTPVSVIGEYCFFECKTMTTVSLPSNLTRIEDSAFGYCVNLTSLTIPATVTYIGDDAFAQCAALEKLSIKSPTLEIGSYPFACIGESAANGTAVTFTGSVNVIPANLFGLSNSNITSVSFGSGVTEIGKNAFADCAHLSSVTWGSKIKVIGANAFSNCVKLIDCNLPDSVTTIGEYAFSGCSSLYFVTLPKKLTSLGNMCFYNCTGLQTITLNSTALGECSPLSFFNAGAYAPKGITVTVAEGVKSIPAHLFGSDPANPTCIKTISLSSTVETICAGAFEGCAVLTELNVPANSALTTIEAAAFASCTGFTRFEMPMTVKSVGAGAFSDCSKLTLMIVMNPDIELAEDKGTLGIPGTTMIRCTADSNPHVYAVAYGYKADLMPTQFDDVLNGAYYVPAVKWAVANDVTSGTSATTFSPNKDCTRGQVVTFLWRAAGQPAPTVTTHPFTDVKENAFYYNAMLWAVENGITAGVSKSSFGPSRTCTRGQIVTFLWRFKGCPDPTVTDHPFTDIKAGASYYEPVLWAVENGITNGASATTFAPSKACTRGQVVTFLYRAMNQ